MRPYAAIAPQASSLRSGLRHAVVHGRPASACREVIDVNAIKRNAILMLAGVAGILAGGLSAWAGGASLGMYFAGVGLVSLILPHLVLAEQSPWRRGAIALAAAGGAGMVWLLLDADATLAQRLLSLLVLLAYAAALSGLAVALRRTSLPAAAAAAIVIALAFAWLSWPIWLSPWLEGAQGESIAGALVPVHPLMGVNAIFDERGIWTQQATLMYSLSNLGQHVRYAFPLHPWWSILLHALLGAVLILAGHWRLERI